MAKDKKENNEAVNIDKDEIIKELRKALTVTWETQEKYFRLMRKVSDNAELIAKLPNALRDMAIFDQVKVLECLSALVDAAAELNEEYHFCDKKADIYE